MWDKTKHPTSGEECQAFISKATGHVLSKSNKSLVPSHKEGDDGALKHMCRLSLQLTQLKKNALNNCDLIHVFTIVELCDVHESELVDLTTKTHNLFADCTRLHPNITTVSCGWCNRWVGDSHIVNDMEVSHKLFEKNTESDLWTKSLEKHMEECPKMQRGGPLTLAIMLWRIQDVLEDAINNIKGCIKALNIKEQPAENIHCVASLVLTSHQALVLASMKDCSFIPDDFPCVILKIFKTSRVQ